MKPVFKYILVLLIVLAGKISLAQNMAAINAMVNNQSIQISINMMNRMSMMMMLNRGDFNFKHKFFATMANGSRKEIDSRILTDEATHKTYLLYVDKNLPRSDSNRNQKIYPDQTLGIERIGFALVPDPRFAFKSNTVEKIWKGVAKDSCWMFKVISGDINVYSCLSEEYYNQSLVVGIQLHDDGPIVKYNEENLKEILGDDVDALKDIQQKKYFKAIRKYNHNRQKEAEKSAKK
jgi:hypothetical protein